jgi:hypothetical protein
LFAAKTALGSSPAFLARATASPEAFWSRLRPSTSGNRRRREASSAASAVFKSSHKWQPGRE